MSLKGNLYNENISGSLQERSSLKGDLNQKNLLSGKLEIASTLSGTVGDSNSLQGDISCKESLIGEIENSQKEISGSLSEDNLQVQGIIYGNFLRGLSAYQIAVLNGFKGSEEQWLDSLHGDYNNNYELLKNLPKINGNQIIGDKQLLDFGVRTVSNEEIEEMFK